MPIIKIISLYAESHLPKKGWLQACIMCEIITSNINHDRTLKIKNKTFEIQTYLCPHCQRKLSDVEFNDKYKSVVQNMTDNGDIFLTS
jgi:uncharacterized protein YlaI